MISLLVRQIDGGLKGPNRADRISNHG